MNSSTTPIRDVMREERFAGCGNICAGGFLSELTALGLLKHPAKTFIGRIDKGFDVLGYHIRPEGLTVARKTVEQFVARARRLYERERGRREAAAQLGAYVQRWVRWVQAGLRVRGEGAARPTWGWEYWWGRSGGEIRVLRTRPHEVCALWRCPRPVADLALAGDLK